MGEFAKSLDFDFDRNLEEWSMPPKSDKRNVRERAKEMNESGMFSQPITEFELKELDRKQFLYRIHEFSPKEVMEMSQRIFAEAAVIGGLPKHHSEALTKKGHLLPFLLGYDQLMWKRWDYWLDIVQAGTIEGSGPIPQIEWCNDSRVTDPVRKMLFHCMDGVCYEGVSIHDFADWLLWGLGAADKPPNISAKVNEHWYRTFDLALVLRYPTDYMSRLLEELAGKGYQDALGYFATPFSVSTMMTEMTFADVSPEEAKTQTFNDPCVGCGAMMLPASNYTLFGCAQDISPIAIKLCRIQMFWYAPWFAMNPFFSNMQTENQ